MLARSLAQPLIVIVDLFRLHYLGAIYAAALVSEPRGGRVESRISFLGFAL